MKVKTELIFEDGDINLIKTILPKNPCTDCPAKGRCNGCYKHGEYAKAINPIKAANVLEYALMYNRAIEIEGFLEDLTKEKQKLVAELQNIGIEI